MRNRNLTAGVICAVLRFIDRVTAPLKSPSTRPQEPERSRFGGPAAWLEDPVSPSPAESSSTSPDLRITIPSPCALPSQT